MRSVLATILVAQLAGWAPMASAQEADAGVSAPFAETVIPTDLNVHAARISVELSDGGVGPEIDVIGGSWWSTGETLMIGKRSASLVSENETLKAAPVATPKWIFALLGVGLVVGLCAGFYLGWWLHGQVLK
jgi:hypothetical protein